MISDTILKSFKGKNVLVTGGTGMIGRQIVDIMVDSDAYVKSVSLDSFITNNRAQHAKADLCYFDIAKEMVKDMDFVFHIAGIKGSIDVTKSKPASFFVPLLMINTNILEASRLEGVQKVVYTSSIGAYSSAEIFKESNSDTGIPMDEFPGLAKRIAEKQILSYRIQHGLFDFSIVRLANVYGPGDNFDPDNAMVIPSLIHRIFNKENPVKIWGDGSAIRDFCYSKDAAEGTILALYYGTDSKCINIGSGIGYTIKYLVECLHDFIDFNYNFDCSKSSGFPKRVMDISLAKDRFGYSPDVDLPEGLKKTWKWFLGNSSDYLKKCNYFV